MEFNISDLLDGLREVDVDIQPNTRASANRIKELTMKKIHTENTKKHRSLSALTKILIAAAILSSLALPVMAATGFHFTDWLEGLFTTGTDYSSDLSEGSASKNWQVSGYVVELKAEDSSAQGLTLTCEEWGNGEKTGTLTADDSFWLEQWNGREYTALTPASQPVAGKTATIAPNKTVTWQVNWSGSYGALASGSYRIGKTFTYTAPNGKTQNVEFYAKFRVFTEDMAPYIEKCKVALDTLREQKQYNVTLTFYPEETEQDLYNYDYYTSQVWRDGDDFLQELTYCNHDGSIVTHRGYLLRDGKGYSLSWDGNNTLSGVSSWETADFVSTDNFDLWYSMLQIFDVHVGEVYVEGNEITLLNSSQYELEAEPDYWELVFTLNAQDGISSIQYLELPEKNCEDAEKWVQYDFQVNNTSAAEIAKTIAAQNVDKPASFSWKAEQAKYPAGSDGVKAEGFANTAARKVDLQNVVSLAQNECTLEWQNTAVVFYDETAQVWKVELGFSQDDSCQTVYLDAEGRTLLVVTK